MPVAQLMEKAGQAVANAVVEIARPGSLVAILCGPGNNGGDGLVVARLLHKLGYEPRAYLAAEDSKLSDDCRAQRDVLQEIAIPCAQPGSDGWDRLAADVAESPVVVDGLLGTGQSGAPRGAILECVEAIRSSDAAVVSIDVPTGIDADSGASLGAHVDADVTVTMVVAKQCFFQGKGSEACGVWAMAEIGIPPEAYRGPLVGAILTAAEVSKSLGVRSIHSHKGENGHVLIVAGSEQMRGAATLAAAGALRAGAGMVTVASTPAVIDAVAAHLPEAMLMPLDATADASQILGSMDRYGSAVFGPGLTTSDPVPKLLAEVWRPWTVPSVIDADALNAVALGVDLPKADCVLTPHPGEMARLLSTTTDKVQSDRFGQVRAASTKYEKCVVLKGAYSLIAEPGSEIAVNPTGNPGMAAAGMGDVLAGVIAGLIAQGHTPLEAAKIGTFLHGAAGDHCAETYGPVGFTALEVAGAIPVARAKLEAC